MKNLTAIVCLLFCFLEGSGQAPKLYVHIVSHNEPTDNIDASAFIFNRFRNNTLQMANLVDTHHAKWNLQTSDGFIIGSLNFENAGISSFDVFETIANPPFSDNIEIDPRSKNKDGRNIADQYYLLDSVGANPSATVGGFLWYICQPSSLQPDWWQYQDTLIGNIYNNKVKFTIMSGAGSAGASLHCNDLKDFGLFKPDTITNFYQHNPSRNTWCIGTGCAPVLDSLSDEQAIIDLIQAQVDSIQQGLWPGNKFYTTRIMTNQREYGPLFFQKIARVIDSLNAIPASHLQWATISETFVEFQNWQQSSGLDYSLWNCNPNLNTGNLEAKSTGLVELNPNPIEGELYIYFPDEKSHTIVLYDAKGTQILQSSVNSKETLDFSALLPGMYFLLTDGNNYKKIVKL